MKVILVILSVAIASSSGSKLTFAQEKDLANIQSRIINGYSAKQGEVPYIVGLSFSDGEFRYRCGGSIIGNTWILTAAHCVKGKVSVKILYGSNIWNDQLDQFTEEIASSNFIQHPQYKGRPDHHNDIALIHTPYVQFTKLINKIRLVDRDNSYEGSQSTACGWGCIQFGILTRTQDLRCVNLNVMNKVQCSQSWESAPVHLSDGTLCVSNFEGKSTCLGDSGGPLVTSEGLLIGVSSLGGEFRLARPAVFTRVSAYLDWIHDITGIE